MSDACAFFRRGLRRPNIKLAVHRDGIAVYDFAIELLGQSDGESGFAARGWTKNDNQERIGLRRSHGQRKLQWMACQ
jgi:hypothetical protein